MKERLVRLNPSVKINVISDSIESKDSSFYKEFDVVCVTGKSLDLLVCFHYYYYYYYNYYYRYNYYNYYYYFF